MLSAFFDLPAPPRPQQQQPKHTKKPAGKRRTAVAAKKEPKAAEGTATFHAKFKPLPDEKNVPRAAEQPGQAWQALQGSGVTRDDDVAEFRADWETEEQAWDEADEVEPMDDDDRSEPDYEPESLDSTALDVSLGSSVDEDDATVQNFFQARRMRRRCRLQEQAVYSGPMLCCENDDF